MNDEDLDDEGLEDEDLEDWPTPLGRQPKSYLYLIAGIAIVFFVGMNILMVVTIVLYGLYLVLP